MRFTEIMQRRVQTLFRDNNETRYRRYSGDDNEKRYRDAIDGDNTNPGTSSSYVNEG